NKKMAAARNNSTWRFFHQERKDLYTDIKKLVGHRGRDITQKHYFSQRKIVFFCCALKLISIPGCLLRARHRAGANTILVTKALPQDVALFVHKAQASVLYPIVNEVCRPKLHTLFRSNE